MRQPGAAEHLGEAHMDNAADTGQESDSFRA
jgi:hypothetical protein